MVTNRKPSQQSVVLDNIIVGIIPINTFSVLTVSCMEISTTNHQEGEERKELTGNTPRRAVAKPAYLATRNRIAAGVMRFLGFHMYKI